MCIGHRPAVGHWNNAFLDLSPQGPVAYMTKQGHHQGTGVAPDLSKVVGLWFPLLPRSGFPLLAEDETRDSRISLHWFYVVVGNTQELT